ncbi:MAG: glycosyltransferase family 2 protein [Gammaproteobacteria bacterium]|nr:glycosyltransferase family 2 protein [Gammaproteobacteria bacterium]
MSTRLRKAIYHPFSGIIRRKVTDQRRLGNKLVMTLLVKDEIDIVKRTIDHHYASGVDFIVATDNESTDGTYELL